MVPPDIQPSTWQGWWPSLGNILETGTAGTQIPTESDHSTPPPLCTHRKRAKDLHWLNGIDGSTKRV